MITLPVKINPHAFLVETGVAINPKPFIDNGTGLEVAAMRTEVSTVVNLVYSFL